MCPAKVTGCIHSSTQNRARVAARPRPSATLQCLAVRVARTLNTVAMAVCVRASRLRYASTPALVAATIAACAVAAHKDGPGAAPTRVPQPLAFWTFQEPTGAPRVSTHARHTYALTDGDSEHPVESTTSEGLFGPRAANFTAASPTQRLRAVRSAVPALTTDLAGAEAVVTVVAWVKRPSGRYFHGFLAGVW